MKKFDWKKLFYTILSSTIYSIGVLMFLEPIKIYSGGIAGVSQLVANISEKFFNKELNLGVIVLLLNIPFLFLAYFGISKKYCFFTALSVLIQSSILGLVPNMPIDGIEMITSAIMGGIVCGLGIALALRWGVSTGSLDVVAQYVALKKGVSVGKMTLFVNCTIAVIAGILFEPAKAVYTIIRIILNSVMIEIVHTSYNSILVKIVTNLGDEISDELIRRTKHTVTKIECIGQFQHQKKDLLEIVVSKHELIKVLSVLSEIDPKAFVYTASIKHIYGNFKRQVIE